MPIDNRDYTQGKDTKRYREWEAEKGVPEEDIKEEWRRGRGYLPERKPPIPAATKTHSITQRKTEQPKLAGIPKLLWIVLAIAIVFFIVACVTQ